MKQTGLAKASQVSNKAAQPQRSFQSLEGESSEGEAQERYEVK